MRSMTTARTRQVSTTARSDVTDGGSVAAHASLVAREYGLPAVVAAEGATSRLRDGMIVTVDGSAGTVELASS